MDHKIFLSRTSDMEMLNSSTQYPAHPYLLSMKFNIRCYFILTPIKPWQFVRNFPANRIRDTDKLNPH